MKDMGEGFPQRLGRIISAAQLWPKHGGEQVRVDGLCRDGHARFADRHGSESVFDRHFDQRPALARRGFKFGQLRERHLTVRFVRERSRGPTAGLFACRADE